MVAGYRTATSEDRQAALPDTQRGRRSASSIVGLGEVDKSHRDVRPIAGLESRGGNPVKVTTCTLFFLFVLNATTQEIRRAELAGRLIEMSVVRAEDLSPQAWPQQQMVLKQISATVTRDTNVYILLQANGIAPDPGAFALVYDLNPGLKDVNALPPDTFLQLPSIAGGEGLKKLLQDRDLVELSVDPEIRQALNQRIEALQLL